ncbi:hypothetical protein AB0M02_30430 [Actinoplanes sp. NPDC051861]|uniref:hypothetical protein n=1 Tax=Actinoplanes sp. NPDC051861 TaxID=3155170 RepID=UPI0034121E74
MTGAEFEGVDLDLLADYVGGALDGTPDEDRVTSLIAEDPAWQAAYEQLVPAMSSVGAMLLDLPPEPMPGDLAARLDSLFTVPAEETPAPGESASSVPVQVLDLDERRRDRAARAGARRRMRWAGPVSVAAGVLAFAGFGLSQISGGAEDSGGGSSQAAEGAADNAAPAPMLAEDAPTVGQVLHSGTDYSAGTLDSISAQRAAQAQTAGSSDAPDEITAAKEGLSRLLAPDLLASCLEAIARENAGGPIEAQLVDYASFEGQPALIVRFSAANGIWAWAVGPDCGTPGAGAAGLGQVPVR